MEPDFAGLLPGIATHQQFRPVPGDRTGTAPGVDQRLPVRITAASRRFRVEFRLDGPAQPIYRVSGIAAGRPHAFDQHQ